MARINIEDSWWVSARRSALIRLLGSEEMADGAAVRLWRMGQDYWKENRQAIPKQCFDLLGCAKALLESGLAVLQGDEVWVRGAQKHYEWLDKKKLAGKKGGKVSAQRQRDSSGKLQAKAKQNPSTDQAETKQNQASSSSSSSSSSSCSPSNSSSISKNNNAGIRSEYPAQFSQLWEKYNRKGDKKQSYEVFKKLNLSEEEVQQLSIAISNYKESQPDEQYRKDFQRYLNTDWREDLIKKQKPQFIKPEFKTKQQLLHEANDAFFAKQMSELEQQEGATNDKKYFDDTASWIS